MNIEKYFWNKQQKGGWKVKNGLKVQMDLE